MSTSRAPQLSELQQIFWRLISAPEGAAAGADGLVREGRLSSADLSQWIRSNERLSAVERVDVYADMYFYRLRDCLLEDYPRLAYRLGPARFHNLVTDYLLAHPSRHFSLRELGRALPDFLASHALADERPDLADLARLEWARVDVFDARDAAPLAASDLSSEDMMVALCPALRLLTVRGAALRLWLDSDEALAGGEGTCTVCVWRLGFAVHHRSLTEDEAACLTELACGPRSLAAIAECLALHFERSGESQADLPARLAGHLSRWLADGLLVAEGA